MYFLCTMAQSYGELYLLIEDYIKSNQLSGKPDSLYQPMNYMMQLGGKRIRPALTLMAARLFGLEPSKAMPQAIAMEVFHNFTLVHDDIMDNSDIRRGKETVHKKWGTSTAILAGDNLMIASYEMLLKNNPANGFEILQLLNNTAREVCEGQQMDMDFEQSDNVTEADYLEMIKLKTAVLLGCSLKTGALVAGASKDNADKMYNLGIYLGLEFQLNDDLLDAFGDPAHTGKKLGGDIGAGKKTLLAIEANLLANESQKAIINDENLRKNNTDQYINSVLKIYEVLGIKKRVMEITEEYHSKSDQLFDEIDVPSETKEPLLDLVKILRERNS